MPLERIQKTINELLRRSILSELNTKVTRSSYILVKCKRFKVRKYTAAMMASTQLYSHRQDIHL